MSLIFIITSVTVPTLVYFLTPKILERISNRKPESKRLLIIAGLIFFISWYLPSPLIQGEQTAAVTHFIGGGIYTGILWFYIKRHLRWQAPAVLELFSLLALVSVLGVTNEIFELWTVNVGLSSLDLSDTPRDLLMNTLGATCFWVIYQANKLIFVSKKKAAEVIPRN